MRKYGRKRTLNFCTVFLYEAISVILTVTPSVLSVPKSAVGKAKISPYAYVFAEFAVFPEVSEYVPSMLDSLFHYQGLHLGRPAPLLPKADQILAGFPGEHTTEKKS